MFNLTSNGMGGVDWQGVQLVAALNGVEDIDALVHRLGLIKNHRPPKPGGEE